MKICITGGAGFLGLHLATFLSKKGHDLTLVDVAPFHVKEYPKSCRYVRADVRSAKIIGKVLQDCDVVIHAAAALPLWKREDVFDINVRGTRNLLNASLRNNIKQFVFVSSTAVYGIPKKHSIVEDDPLKGVGPYGESKIRAEKLCSQFRKKGMVVTVVRPKTFIGSHRLGVFEILFDWIKDGKKIPMIGGGNNRYQLLDVDDLVEAIYLLTTKDKKKVNTVFNVASESFGTVNSDLNALFVYAHSSSKIFPTPAFLVKKILWFLEKIGLSPLYQWVYDTADKDSYVSIHRLTKTLSWHPKYSNTQALIKAYRWYEKHYEEIKSSPSGVTHTAGWKQGALSLVKKFM